VAGVSVTPIVALDVRTPDAALHLVDLLGDSADFYKVGNELFTSVGPAIVRSIRDRGSRVFLDLKFHDIPNTVAGGVRAAAELGAAITTVNVSCGLRMLDAAPRAAGPDCLVAAVSVLTSLDAASLGAAWGREGLDVEQEVVRLARAAHGAGIGALVCSGEEARAVRGALDGALRLVVPGIRFADSAAHDQARVMTPRRAAEAGADYVVVGRAVTESADPVAAMQRLRAELDSGLND
jgi:orotidine-5'-phosphate decarboxylase